MTSNNLHIALDNALTASDNYAIFTAVQNLAQAGNAEYYAYLAQFYESGDQPEGKRPDLAFHWYSKSIHEGDYQEGYFGLGRLYFNGTGAETDYRKAIEYFETALYKGSLEAGLVLGYCYFSGLGVVCDLEKAATLLQPTADKGYVLAIALLSKIAFKRKRWLRGMRLYVKAVLGGVRRIKEDPDDPKLYWVNFTPPA